MQTQIILIVLLGLATAHIVYANLGYYLALRLLALFGQNRRRSRRGLANEQQVLPSVTLIIPAHNEECVIRTKLENALQLDYPGDKWEVLLANDGSDDQTAEIAGEFETRGVKVLDFATRRGKISLLNDAVAEAKGDVVCFCDANVIFATDAIHALVQKLESGVGAVSGDVQLASHESNFGQGESLYYWLERRIHNLESDIGSMMGVDGGMYILRKELYRPLPADTILDDFVISMQVFKQRQRIAFAPSAVARENGTPTARQEFQRRVRVAAGAVQSIKRGEFPPVSQPFHLWQYYSHKVVRWTCPLALLVALICSVFLVASSAWYWPVLAAQLMFYGIAVAAAINLPLRATRVGGACFYFSMSHVAILIGSWKGLFDWQAVTWSRTERRSSIGNRHDGQSMEDSWNGATPVDNSGMQ